MVEKKTKIERWHVITAVLFAAVVGLIVWKRSDSGESSSISDAGAEPAAATPGNLLFDLTMSSPNSSWTKLQRGVGGAMGILPATLPGMIVAVADLDLLLANELDGTSPMFGAAAGDVMNPSVVLAMKLVDPRRTRALLVDGEAGAAYSGRDVPGMTLLTPSRAQALNRDHHFEAAITKNGYLIVGRKTEDLTSLGPYVTRTLASRPIDASSSATIEIPKTALQTALKPKIESAWQDGKQYLLAQDERMRAEKGRAPDFGDPQSIIATLDTMFGRRMAILSDLEKIKVAIDVLDDAVVVTSTLAPAEKGEAAKTWVKSMKVGDASAVTSLPLVSTFVFASRDDEPDRKAQIEGLEKGIALSAGPRLKDPAKLHEPLEALMKASDESFAIAAGLEEPAGALLKAHVRDVDAANKSLHGLVDLTKANPFKEMLRVKEVTSSSEDLPGLGKINVVTITREAPKANEPPLRRGGDGDAAATPPAAAVGKTKPLGVAWVIDSESNLLIGAGAEPTVTLKVGAKPEKKIADEPSLKRFIGAIGSDASTLIVAQPLRLDPKRANLPVAPVGIAVGRKGNDAFVKIDINDGLLREIARWQMGF